MTIAIPTKYLATLCLGRPDNFLFPNLRNDDIVRHKGVTAFEGAQFSGKKDKAAHSSSTRSLV